MHPTSTNWFSRKNGKPGYGRRFRSPFKVVRDIRARYAMSRELMRLGERSHERLAGMFNESGRRSYASMLSSYVQDFLPDIVSRLWEEDGFSVTVTTKQGMARHLTSVARRSGTKLKKREIETTNGLYVPVQGIFVREDTFPYKVAFFGGYQWQHMEDICGHEFGHYVDDIHEYPSEWDGMFLRAYSDERHRLDPYSGSDPHEYFATACWICARWPRTARKFIPKTARYFRVLFENC